VLTQCCASSGQSIPPAIQSTAADLLLGSACNFRRKLGQIERLMMALSSPGLHAPPAALGRSDLHRVRRRRNSGYPHNSSRHGGPALRGAGRVWRMPLMAAGGLLGATFLESRRTDNSLEHESNSIRSRGPPSPAIRERKDQRSVPPWPAANLWNLVVLASPESRVRPQVSIWV